MKTLILLALLYACAPNPAYADQHSRQLSSVESKANAAILFCKFLSSKDEVLKCYEKALKTIREVANQKSIEEQPNVPNVTKGDSK